MKSRISGRRHKAPHQNESFEKKEAPFFSKENKAPFFNGKGTGIQPKLTVGQPNDKYEKEADSMADAVVNNTSKPDIQNKEISSIQRVSLATPEEDEKFATAEQRMEEDKLIQEKPEGEAMEEPEEEMISKMENEEQEEMVNKKENEEEEEMINKMDDEREEEEPGAIQTKDNTANNTANPGLTQQIKTKAGKGKKLSKNTRAQMEPSFGSDFSEVNVHTDEDAVRMNKELKAQAFTHGKDIYFNSGKYNPDTAEGKRLLAHELTHTIQQKDANNKIERSVIQRMLSCPSTLHEDDPVPVGFKAYQGNSRWFHCGYRGILEDRAPTPKDPQNECFYDTLGRLVDENHENSGCRGTPNDYDSSASTWDHIFKDRGGIWQRGWGAFWSSRFSSEDRPIPTEEEKRQTHEECVVRLGGCPHSRPGGIPTSEEISDYNDNCRSESNYSGPDITPDCDH